MAKSLRSKWKRRLRNIKRERYAVKELKRLKQVLGIADDEPASSNNVLEFNPVMWDLSQRVDKSRDKGGDVISKCKNRPRLDHVIGGRIDYVDDYTSDEEEKSVAVVEPTGEMEMDHSQRGVSNVAVVEPTGEIEMDLSQREVSNVAVVEPTGEIEMDHSQKRVFNRKTMRDQFGNYPVWFNSRDIKRRKKREQVKKRKLIDHCRVNKRPRKKLHRRKGRKQDENLKN